MKKKDRNNIIRGLIMKEKEMKDKKRKDGEN